MIPLGGINSKMVVVVDWGTGLSAVGGGSPCSGGLSGQGGELIGGG
jgi:hypothetical protein